MYPIITVYMPTYNRLALLKRAIDSVLSQTYQDFEIIVVDDCSIDGTQEYLQELSSRNKKVRIYLKEKNSGACASRNVAIGMAKGKYITGLDDDDYFHPRRLETLLEKYDSKYSLISTNWFTVKKDKNIVNSYVSRVISIKSLLWGNYIGNQAFVETDRIREVGGFDNELRASQDLDLWIRLVEKYGQAKRIKEALYYFDNSHEFDRISISKARFIGTEQFLKKHGNKMTAQQRQYKLDMAGANKVNYFNKRQQQSLVKNMISDLGRYGFFIFLQAIKLRLKVG